MGGDYGLIDQIKADYATAPVSDKLKALFAVAKKVQIGGKHVTTEDVAKARAQGATDRDIHDTVLIAAAFCMFNRYVDGLATWQPQDSAMYKEMGKRLATTGYLTPGWERPVAKAEAK